MKEATTSTTLPPTTRGKAARDTGQGRSGERRQSLKVPHMTTMTMTTTTTTTTT
eukprot:CAMPEP_0197921722 /NCGR_PEP_ID=MMETSP1439-20131203/91118_1 /TAXON_ID=66791 /ORGANISM="Gonyaulax spinifera, Strain CCMP409" /LENGTH=53 /DNA_ID=CAMNT_0043543983 /DNA_START=29 /DNA_END=186 /DNA_ORIENTATION=-